MASQTSRPQSSTETLRSPAAAEGAAAPDTAHQRAGAISRSLVTKICGHKLRQAAQQSWALQLLAGMAASTLADTEAPAPAGAGGARPR